MNIFAIDEKNNDDNFFIYIEDSVTDESGILDETESTSQGSFESKTRF